MRSNSMGWLLETAGFEVETLEKGYKVFRNFILDQFAEERPIIILSGYTGTGKTNILHALRKYGEQVIDLEKLAHHKGSAFGHLGEENQPTGEQFENLLGMALHQTNKKRPVWLEDESRFIGRRCIPHQLFNQMKSALVLKIEVSREERIHRLVHDYSNYSLEDLEESITKIRKRLGGLHTQQAIEALEKGEFDKVAEFVLHYYDKAYDHQLQKRDPDQICTLSVDNINPEAIARTLLEQTAAETG
jgi:tRNA 2-selenouridine synthase